MPLTHLHRTNGASLNKPNTEQAIILSKLVEKIIMAVCLTVLIHYSIHVLVFIFYECMPITHVYPCARKQLVQSSVTENVGPEQPLLMTCIRTKNEWQNAVGSMNPQRNKRYTILFLTCSAVTSTEREERFTHNYLYLVLAQAHP